jgi:type I restriction enzyme S subunit
MSVAAIELGQVCRLDRRVTAASEALSKGLEFVGMEHVDPESGRIVLGQGSRTGEGKGQAFLFDNRHVLFGKLRPYLRKIALPGQSGCASTELVPLLPDAARLDRGYLFHWVRRQHVIDALMAKNTGARMPRADMSVLLDMAIPLPPLDEQRRIVGLLDRAAEIRLRADAARAKARAIIPALFLDMFGDPATNPKGWPVVMIGEAGEVKLGRQRAPKYQSGKFTRPYVRVANVFENMIDVSDLLSMDFEERDYTNYRLSHGDILLNEGQSIELVGRPAMWRDEVENCCFQNTLVRFRCAPEKIVPDFALAAFLRMYHDGHLSKIASKTSNVAHLGAGRFAKLPIVLPPIPLQTAFAETAQRLDSLARQLDAAAAKAEAMAAGLSAEVFDAGQRKDTADGPSAQC